MVALPTEEQLAQLQSVMDRGNFAKLMGKMEALKPSVEALSDDQPENDAEARKKLAAERQGVIDILESDSRLKLSGAKGQVITAVSAAFNSFEEEDAEERKKKQQAVAPAVEQQQAPDIASAFIMLIMGFFTGNQEMMSQGMTALGMGGASTAPVDAQRPENVPADARNPENIPAAPAVDATYATSVAASQAAGTLTREIGKLEAEKNSIQKTDTTKQAEAFDKLLTVSNTLATPKSMTDSYIAAAETYYFKDGMAEVLNGARRHNLNYGEEKIGGNSYEIPIAYNRVSGYQGIDEEIATNKAYPKPQLDLEDASKKLINYGAQVAHEEVKRQLASMGMEKFIMDAQNDPAAVDASLSTQRKQLELNLAKVEASHDEYKNKLETVERLKAIQKAMELNKGSSWFKQSDDLKRYDANRAIENELSTLEPDLKKSKEVFKNDLKQFEEASLELGKLEAQQRLLQSSQFEALVQAEKANIAAANQTKMLDEKISGLAMQLGRAQASIEPLKQREAAAEAAALTKAAAQLGGVGNENPKTLQEDPALTRAAEKLGGEPQKEVSAGSGVSAVGERRKQLQAELSVAEGQLRIEAAKLKEMEAVLLKEQSDADIAKAKSHISEMNGHTAAHISAATNVNGLTNYAVVGVQAHVTPNPVVHNQAEVAKAQALANFKKEQFEANKAKQEARDGGIEEQRKLVASLRATVHDLQHDLVGEPSPRERQRAEQLVRESTGIQDRALVKAIAEELLYDPDLKREITKLNSLDSSREVYQRSLARPASDHSPRYSMRDDDPWKSSIKNDATAKYNDREAEKLAGVLQAREEYKRSNTEQGSIRNQNEIARTEQPLLTRAQELYLERLEAKMKPINDNLQTIDTSYQALASAASQIREQVVGTLHAAETVDAKKLVAVASQFDKEAKLAESKGLKEAAEKLRHAAKEIGSKVTNSVAPGEARVTAAEAADIETTLAGLGAALANSRDQDAAALQAKRAEIEQAMLKSQNRSRGSAGPNELVAGIADALKGAGVGRQMPESVDLRSEPLERSIAGKKPKNDSYDAFIAASNQMADAIGGRVNKASKAMDKFEASHDERLKPSAGGQKPTTPDGPARRS